FGTNRGAIMAGQSAQACVDACNACVDACNRCATACLQEDDVKTMARCIALDIDCTAACQLTAGAVARSSELLGAICALCAEICDACGAECARHDHEHCRVCAAACGECADACRAMSVGG